MTDQDRLYALLPAIFRQRDAQGQLRALMAVFTDVLDSLQDDTAALYDDSFIETCSPAMVAFIGARVDLAPTELWPEARGLVANAVRWRRRKGVATVLQPRIRETCGWFARVTQPPADGVFRVMIEIWRRAPLVQEGVAPTPAGAAPYRWTFAAGPVPLVNAPTQSPGPDESAPDAALPVLLTREALMADISDWLRQRDGAGSSGPDSAFYGQGRGLVIRADDVALPPDRILPRALRGTDPPPGTYPAIWSTPLDARIALPEQARLGVSFGGEQTYAVDLGPAGDLTRGQAIDRLRQGLKAASSDPVCADAVTLASAGSLAVVAGPGASAPPAFADRDVPGLAALLGLAQPTPVTARRSAIVDRAALLDLGQAGALAVNVQLDQSAADLDLPLPIATPAALAKALRDALRAAVPKGPAIFGDAAVVVDQGALVSLPGPSAGAQTDGLAFAGPVGARWPIWRLGLGDGVILDPEAGAFAFARVGALPALAVDYAVEGPAPAEDPVRTARLDALLADALAPDVVVERVWRS